MKLSTLLIAAVVLAASSCSRVELPGRDETGGTQQIADELTLADAQATAATKALYRNLWTIADKGFMFGHHDDLMYGCGKDGFAWHGQEGKSDTKDVCGDYPAVMGVDLATLIDDRYNDSPSENELRLRCIRQAYDLGIVVVACPHLDNPLTGGDAWDNSNNKVVSGIPDSGSEVHRTFYSWIDRLADIANSLKGSDGAQIPIILR
ncbi:MAG: beta-mannosidase, partial [Bacteroidales bacterium]|nr:beta-mannosidase [Candidatus Cryptobacteroides aphodequi]